MLGLCTGPGPSHESGAYEIKAHHQDFLRDGKWHRYLKYLEPHMRDLGLDPGGLIARWSVDRKLQDLV